MTVKAFQYIKQKPVFDEKRRNRVLRTLININYKYYSHFQKCSLVLK